MASNTKTAQDAKPITLSTKQLAAALKGKVVQAHAVSDEAFGPVGGFLYVREAWRTWCAPTPMPDGNIEDAFLGVKYMLDGEMVAFAGSRLRAIFDRAYLHRLGTEQASDLQEYGKPRVRSAMTMPEALSRLTLMVQRIDQAYDQQVTYTLARADETGVQR